MMPIVAVHLAVTLAALALGIAVLVRTKGTASHKALGRAWVMLMAIAALSSFSITGLAGAGHLSWIHLLSAWTLVSLVAGVFFIRRGNVRAHRGFMIGVFAGLCIAGVFALLGRGRLLGEAVFGG